MCYEVLQSWIIDLTGSKGRYHESIDDLTPTSTSGGGQPSWAERERIKRQTYSFLSNRLACCRKSVDSEFATCRL
jgi:hypothetical protein